MKNNFDKILNELSYRVSTGIPDLSNEQHLIKLWDILKEHNWNIDARVELLKNLNEIDFKDKAAFAKYNAKHKMRPTTKVKIGSTDTTVGDETGEKDDEPTDTKKAQSNGYVGDKDKTLEQGDPLESEVYNKDLEPDDNKFEEKNKDDKSPEPPSHIKLDDIVKNPKFPKRYLQVLERMANSKLTTKTKKWEHFSDMPGGAGATKAQAGELLAMMGTTMTDEEFNKLSSRLLKQEEELIKNHPEVYKKKNKAGKLIDNPGSRIIDKTWVEAARNNRNAVLQRLEKQYGKGTKIVAAAWDSKEEVEALGMSDYTSNKGFSTDTYFKVETPDGEQVLDEVSNKKSLKVNFLNSGAGDFKNWDPDLSDDINQSVYRNKARKRNVDFVSNNKKEVEKFINSDKGKSIRKLIKTKGVTLEEALQGNSRSKQNILWSSIKELAKNGNEEAKKIKEQDTKEHTEFVEKSVKAISENPKMKAGMLNTIKEEFPLKAVSDREETMAIGANSLDPNTMKEIFGTNNYDEIKEKLVSEPGPPPFVGYNVEATGEVFPVAEVKIREDGRGYGGQFKFEMVLHKDFAPRIESAQEKIYGQGEK